MVTHYRCFTKRSWRFGKNEHRTSSYSSGPLATPVPLPMVADLKALWGALGCARWLCNMRG
jgi:hypothetical protein